MNSVSNQIAFWMDGKLVEIDFAKEQRWTPTTTVLNYLRSLPDQKGTKEGCAEGDCGACTVVLAEPDEKGGLSYKAVDSCLVFLPMISGKQLFTVGSIGNSSQLHPVQKAMVDCDGSQCGYCTPGFVMSLFALYKQEGASDREEILDALTGNLCRCTGYRSIYEAAEQCCQNKAGDQFSNREQETAIRLQEIGHNLGSQTLSAGETQYFRPTSLQEALEIRNAHQDALIVCGATDVGLMVTKKKQHLPKLLDLSGIKDLKGLEIWNGAIKYSATANLELVRKSSRKILPALYDMLAVFGSRQIREQGTIGGNIANASPIGDMPPILMALDASVVVESVEGKREMLLSDFITGYRQTALAPNELITQVIIPLDQKGKQVKSYKISKRKDLDISTVSGGFWLKLNKDGIVDDLALIYGGMAAMTKHAVNAENFLRGKAWSRENIDLALDFIDQDFSPISDARSGKEGRRIMARNLLLKFWADTQARKEAQA